MPPFVKSELSTAVRPDCVSEVPSLVSAKNWSAAADSGRSDFDTLVQVMGLDRQGVVQLLLEKGSRVIAKVNPVLHKAVARMDWSSVVERLLELGAKVGERNSHGDTALHLAFVNGATDGVVDLLLANYLGEATTNAENNDGLSFLHIACGRSNPAFAQELIERGVHDINAQVHVQRRLPYAGYTPLHFAVLHGRYEIAQLLLRNGASIYVQDRTASTPLHLALYTGDQEMIDLLLAYDQRKENYIDNFGLTHFMAACAGSMPYVVEAFLHKHPLAFHRVNSRVQEVSDHYAGYSPIHFATEFGNRETVELLLNYDASTFSKTKDNWSPMALATYNGHEDILRLLQRYSTRENDVFIVDKISDMSSNYKWPNF